MSAERESLIESLREIAESIVDASTDEGKSLLRAADEIERLQGIERAAREVLAYEGDHPTAWNLSQLRSLVDG